MKIYIIEDILSLLINIHVTSSLPKWYFMAHLSIQIISAKTRCKTHGGEFLAIIDDFKIWREY